jgi:hypothetical protein
MPKLFITLPTAHQRLDAPDNQLPYKRPEIAINSHLAAAIGRSCS